MKSTAHAKEHVFKLLFSSGIQSTIKGKIYKDKRPVESKGEDIVINSLDGDSEILQSFGINVNCHVPYVQVQDSPGAPMYYRKDNKRIMIIFDAVSEIIKEHYNSEYDLKLLRFEEIDIDEEKTMFINFRLDLIIY